ncbi:MAG: 1-acyl-sn-glycerol-3-phosphate acyltransferase [Campylobacter sp.]|nr:1-acyl-sn-glycerol-3-phosphate acyltransferase [Campylobacter sp.]
MMKFKSYTYALMCAITILFLVFLFKLMPSKNWSMRKKWAKIQRFLIGYELNQIGEFEDADMIMINHKSMLDIIILEEIYPKNLAWIAKKEISDMKFFGGIMKTPKMIEVDRSNSRSIVKLISDVKDRLKDDRVIAIFPEGTRGKSDKMLKFHSGAKILTQKLNLKVQPIVLKDTLYHLDIKKMEVRGGKIDIVCLPLVDTSDLQWYEKTEAKMQNVYDEIGKINLQEGKESR